MKKNILSLVLLIVLLATFSVVVYGWLVDGSVSNLTLNTNKIDGLSINVYRGYDYDLNGALDIHEMSEGDLNNQYIAILPNDTVSNMMESSVVTYRCIIKNESDYEVRINPYFTFSDITKQSSVLFSLNQTTNIDHSFLSQSGELISSSAYTTGNYYDEFGNIINTISDGSNYYRLVMETGVLKFKNELNEDINDIDLTKMFNSTYYDKLGTLINQDSYNLVNGIYNSNAEPVLSITNGQTSYTLSYNEMGVCTGVIGSSGTNTTINLNYFYPIVRTNHDRNLSLYMYDEIFYEFVVLPDTETYFDLTIKAASLIAIREAMNEFVLSPTYQGLMKHYDLINGVYDAELEPIQSVVIDGVTYTISYVDGDVTVVASDGSTDTVVDLTQSNLVDYFSHDYYLFDQIHTNKAASTLTTASLHISFFSFDCEIITGEINEQVGGGA